MNLSRRSLISASSAGVVASALSIPAITRASQTPSPDTATPSAGEANIEATLRATIDEHDIPGAIVLVASPELGHLTTAVGVANLETGAPMTVDMHMRIGSITKTFTATMVLQLVDQGALALDDTLAALYPELASLPNADSMTVRHLLAMQSGVVDPEIETEVTPGPNGFTPEEILELMANTPAAFAPGEEGMYANLNYLILGMVAEHVTGTPWRDLIQTGILDEAGLVDTSIPETVELPSPSPRGYVFRHPVPQPAGSATPAATAGPKDVTELDPSTLGASGSMVSTAHDLNKWMSTLIEGTLLSSESHAAQFDVSNAKKFDGITYGLGIGNVDGLVGHVGGIEGFSSSMFHVPDRETTIVTLANVYPAREGGDPSFALMEAILGA